MNPPYHPQIYQLLELAETKTSLKEIPPELQTALKAVNGDLVAIEPPHPRGWTETKTTEKKACDLRPDDVIRLRPDDKHGYRVTQVTVDYHTVEVFGTGVPIEYPHNTRVTVFDGPPPEQQFTPERLLLTDKGERVRAMNLLSTTAATPAVSKRTPRKKVATVKQRMEDMLTDDPSRVSWSAQDWADALVCEKSSVIQNNSAWTKIMTARAMMKADRINRGKRDRDE